MGRIIEYNGKKPALGRGVFLAPGSTVVGDVKIGDYSTIWYNAVVRGDVERIEIGAYSNIQDGAILHGTKGKYPVFIGDYVTIGHRAVIHGASVSSFVLIGIGAVVLDDVEIGENVIVGAQALVPPHTKIPPGVLVLGVPAKVVRELHEEEVSMIKEIARRYVKYAELTKEGLGE